MEDIIELPKDEFLTKLLQNSNNNNNNPLYKRAVLILEATRDALKEKFGHLNSSSEYDTAFFASLYDYLKQIIQKDAYDNAESTLFLFNYAVHKVNPAILNKLSQDIIKTLIAMTNKVRKSPYAFKYIISIYQSILQTKTTEEWQKPEIIQALDFILDCLLDDKIKVRKQAGKSLSYLVENIISKLFTTQVYIQKFIMSIIEESNNNTKPMIYLLYFLNTSLKLFPISIISDICYGLIKTLRNENYDAELATHTYSTLENLMANRPLSSDLVEFIIKDILNNPPNIFEESNIGFTYVQCLTQALLHLNNVEERLAKSYISSTLLVCSEFLLALNEKLAKLACKSIELIINSTVKKTLWMESSNQMNNNQQLQEELSFDILEITDANGPKAFTKIIVFMNYLLGSRFENAQKYICSILCFFFDKLDSSAGEQLVDLIGKFIDSKPKRPQNLWIMCMGRFLQKMDPEIVLRHSPLKILDYDLNLENYEDLSNSWILPLFKKHLRIDSIRLFMEYFYPIAEKLYDTFGKKMKDEYTDTEKTYQILWLQIWEIFPRFCKFTKSNANFIPEIFAIATEYIQNQEDARRFVAHGLENLVTYFVALPKYKNPEYIAINKSLQEHADKLCPILCKTYISKRAGSKNVLSLLRELAKICSHGYLEKIYNKNVARLIDEKANNKLNSRIIIAAKEADLIINISPAMTIKDAKFDIAIRFIRAFLGESNIFQKKAYKLLNVLIPKVHESFLMQMFDILNEFKVVSPGARGARLICLGSIIQKMEFSSAKLTEILIILQKFLPEILVSLKETNTRTRKISTELIKILSNKMKEAGFKNDLVNLIIGCFASKAPLMKSSAVEAFTLVLKEYHQDLDENFIWELTSIVILMIKEQNREVFKSILSYLKGLFKILKREQITTHIEEILKAVFEWDDDSRECHKSKIRHLLEKLIRKIGKPAVEAALPNDHKKLLKYLNKLEKQQKKKKDDKKEDKKVEKKNNKIFLEDLLDDDVKQEPMVQETKDMKIEMIPENENNLLLKFDANKEKFHFEEHPIAKIKEKQKKEVQIETDVLFSEQIGKILVLENENTYAGKKRKRERYEDMDTVTKEVKQDSMQVEKEGDGHAASANSKKIIKLNNSRGVTVKDSTTQDKEEDKKPKYNPNVISDVKMYTNTADPYAVIQMTPKVLNKRNKANAAKAFEFLISKKKTGALKGIKTKVKE